MCVEIQFCTHHRLWDVLFSLNKSRSLSTTGQALWHLYILSPVIFPLTHMYSVEPSSRRLNCTEVETGHGVGRPPPPDVLSFSIPSSMDLPNFVPLKRRSFIDGKGGAVSERVSSCHTLRSGCSTGTKHNFILFFRWAGPRPHSPFPSQPHFVCKFSGGGDNLSVLRPGSPSITVLVFPDFADAYSHKTTSSRLTQFFVPNTRE